MRYIELKETLIYSSPRRKPGSRLLISLDSGSRRNDDSRIHQRFLNPVRANMVAHPTDYPWSNYAGNAMCEPGVRDTWLTPHMEYTRLGRSQNERQSAYRQLFRAAISGQDLNAIRESTHKGWALGGERFKKQVEALTNRQVVKGHGQAEEYGIIVPDPFSSPLGKRESTRFFLVQRWRFDLPRDDGGEERRQASGERGTLAGVVLSKPYRKRLFTTLLGHVAVGA